jgi:hypothetical protein
MAALREAKRQASRQSSPLRRLARLLRTEPTRVATSPITCPCAA